MHRLLLLAVLFLAPQDADCSGGRRAAPRPASSRPAHIVLRTTLAPPPGNYSQARIIDQGSLRIVHTAGQTGNVPATDAVAEGIEAQTLQALENIKGIVSEAGGKIGDIAKVTVFIKDMAANKPGFEAAYRRFFDGQPLPARSMVEVGEIPLPSEPTIVEIEAVAYLKKPRKAGLAPPHSDETARLTRLQAAYAPTRLSVGLSMLPENEQKALAKMVQAGRILDPLYRRQIWSGSEAMRESLAADRTPLGRARLRYFMTNQGPWDVLHDNAPFIPGAPKKPEQANFYPQDATKEEVENWWNGLPQEEKKRAAGFFTVIRRDEDGRLKAVPFSEEYRPELEQAARFLSEAAELTRQPTLKAFLKKRAEAFLSNDYYDSDIAWMELDSSIEATIGPYETYEDGWFSFKAAFQSVLGIRDEAATQDLKRFGSQAQWLEDRLPIAAQYRNPKLGKMTPIRVINQVFTSGNARQGYPMLAFNLPNDEKIKAKHGAKLTLIKNVNHAKFKAVLRPLSRIALSKAHRDRVDFGAFFTHVLMHELMHGLGPQNIVVDGRKTTVREELKDAYDAMEEAKADISGLWALQMLIDKGVIGKKLERSMYDTYLASSFRSIRFGRESAHGRGQALQLNYLLDHGAVKVAKDGTFSIDRKKIRKAVEALTGEIMTIQAKGDYSAAKAMLENLSGIRPETQRVLDRAKHLPVDVELVSDAADQLAKLAQ